MRRAVFSRDIILNRVAPAVLIPAALIFPLIVGERFGYWVHIAASVWLYAILALGLNLVVGYTGLLDLGFMAFYGIGAYTAALLSIHGFGFWVTLPAAVLVASLARLLLGAPVLRLRGDYLAIVTLGFGEIARIVLNNWDSLTNGPKGLPGEGQSIADVRLFGHSLGDPLELAPFGAGRMQIQFDSDAQYYYLILLFLLAGLAASLRLERSRIGRAWVAIREDETAAELMGVEVTRQKLAAFVLSAAYAGAAGCLYAHWVRFIDPTPFAFWDSVLLVCAIVLGGMGSVAGVLLGAIAVAVIPEALRGLGEKFVNLRYLLFGAALVSIAIFRPQGVLPSRRRARELQA